MDFEKFPIDDHECEFRITSAYMDFKTMTMKSQFEYFKEFQRPLQYKVSYGPINSITINTMFILYLTWLH